MVAGPNPRHITDLVGRNNRFFQLASYIRGYAVLFSHLVFVVLPADSYASPAAAGLASAWPVRTGAAHSQPGSATMLAVAHWHPRIVASHGGRSLCANYQAGLAARRKSRHTIIGRSQHHGQTDGHFFSCAHSCSQSHQLQQSQPG